MLKNKICFLILVTAFSIPVFSTESIDTVTPDETKADVAETMYDSPITEGLNNADNLPENAVTSKPMANDLITPTYKQPISKRKIAKKFLFAMLGVLVSSFAIYGILTIYNKVRKIFIQSETVTNSYDENTLESPDNLEDAVKNFLNKTKWE